MDFIQKIYILFTLFFESVFWYTLYRCEKYSGAALSKIGVKRALKYYIC